ncbi:MAG TPA: biotin synthase BioB, partial [Kofleriaceae bacterium]|nr:biotin synthase BioB [Kofleriaceae bacterium]
PRDSLRASPSGEAPIKSVDELVAGARRAYAARAKRYCMVTATRGPSQRDLETICTAAAQIKAEMDIELCASLGLLTEAKAARLASAGIDRFNHNLETSERHYGKIVSTHTWRDRVATVEIAKRAGMDTCSGGIVGLGESEDDLLDLAFALRELDVDSVPVNFLDARPGTPLADYPLVPPGYALRALCMFRFVHPRTDLRVAGGREVTLRKLQVMALYPANSIFTQGYLTTAGATPYDDHQMIRDAGFELELASGETIPADPDAVADLAAPSRRLSLPVARG